MCRNLHLCFCAQCRFVISAFGKIFALQICAFCARRFLSILQICTFVFCTFAEVSNLFLHLCAEVLHVWNSFVNMREHKKYFFSHFSQNFHFWAFFEKKSKKSKFPKMSENVPSVFDVFPKMSEKSSRVPEWYTSGSWANAFDNTGWQKSPEYALIRIAAGAPDLAKSPNPPPDGPGRPRKSRHFSPPDGKAPGFGARARFCSPGWNPFRSCFSWSRAQLVRVVKRIPRRVEFCDRVRHILQMCAHFAKHSLKTAVRAQDILHTVHTVHNRNRTVHTCAQPRHSSRHKWQRTHRPCVALVGKVGGAERPRAIDVEKF